MRTWLPGTRDRSDCDGKVSEFGHKKTASMTRF
jgi:hypothetical protein